MAGDNRFADDASVAGVVRVSHEDRVVGGVAIGIPGDFLFSTFSGGVAGGDDEIIVVRGFLPPNTVDAPPTTWLMALAAALIIAGRRNPGNA
jgi:hypothetical protein